MQGGLWVCVWIVKMAKWTRRLSVSQTDVDASSLPGRWAIWLCWLQSRALSLRPQNPFVFIRDQLFGPIQVVLYFYFNLP